MYSCIFACSSVKLSEGDRNSTTKSGQIGANPSCCSGVSVFQRSNRIQAASGDRLAPFGNVKPVLESNPTPVPSRSAQFINCWVILAFRFPDPDPVGGMMIRSPVAVRSMCRSRLSWQSSKNCSSVISTTGCSRTVKGDCSIVNTLVTQTASIQTWEWIKLWATTSIYQKQFSVDWLQHPSGLAILLRSLLKQEKRSPLLIWIATVYTQVEICFVSSFSALLNLPILGDFELLGSPRIGGWGAIL